MGEKIVSVINAEGPPVPIPNTEVKLCSGDNTSREAVREDSPMLTLDKRADFGLFSKSKLLSLKRKVAKET